MLITCNQHQSGNSQSSTVREKTHIVEYMCETLLYRFITFILDCFYQKSLIKMINDLS